MEEQPDDERTLADMSAVTINADSLARLQTGFEAVSRRVAEGLSGWTPPASALLVPRAEIPDFDLGDIQLLPDRTGANTERLVEIASAQQELLGRLVADQEAAGKLEARRHWQTTWIAVGCTLGGATVGALLSTALT